MEVLTQSSQEDLDVPDAIFARPDLTTCCRLDELGREPDRTKGKRLMTALIESVRHGVPAALTELRTLGRTLTKRAEATPTS